jgi:hypothetical protein
MADLKTPIGCLDPRIDVNQEMMDAWLEEMNAWRKETMTCQVATEAYLERKDPTPMETAKVGAPLSP